MKRCSCGSDGIMPVFAGRPSKLAALACSCILILLPASRAQAIRPAILQTAPSDANLDFSRLPPHPRLFENQRMLLQVRAKQDAVSQQIRALLTAQADAALTAGDITYPASGISLNQMREVQGRILSLAFEYRLTGNRRYFDKARYELLRLSSLRSWNPSHFLDVGEAALAAGIGYDWLYDDLSVEDRNLIVHAIVTNALTPSLHVAEAPDSWVNGDFNWNQVCNGGLTVAALAIADREPDLAQQIVKRAIRNIPTAGATYAPDGTYPEGPSYWIYGTTFHVFCAEALRSALGSTFGLDRLPGFLESAEFKRQTLAPSGKDYNYSDYHEENQDDPVLLWFAGQLKDKDIAAEEFRRLRGASADLSHGTAPLQGAHFVASRHIAFALLWWNPALADGGRPEPLHWTAAGEMPLAVMRSRRDDPRAAYLAIKGGTPNHSHAHMDVGSFIYEADGVRWALDLGTENYDKMRAGNLTLWEYSQGSPRWKTFRVGPDGHNILRFDGQLQNIAGKGTITALPDDKGTMTNIVDLRSIYAGQADAVQRTVQLGGGGSLTIMDRWRATDHATDVTWQWLTRARASATENGFVLEQDGKKLRIVATAGQRLTFDVEDVSQPRATFDSANPGVSRLVIHLHTPARKNDTLTVRAETFQ